MLYNLINPALLAAAGTFVWQEHTREIITAALLSMVPTFEGRCAWACRRCFPICWR